MKKLLFASFMLASTLGMAQTDVAKDLSIKYLPTKFPIYRVQQIDNNTVFGLSQTSKKDYSPIAMLFNIKTAENYSKKLELKDEKIVITQKFNNGVRIVSTKYDKKAQTKKLFQRNLTVTNLEFSATSESVEIMEVSDPEGKLSFHSFQSNDKSKTVFFPYATESVGVNSAIENLKTNLKTNLIQFTTVNYQGEIVNNVSYKTEYDASLIQIQSFAVGNNGSVACLAEIYKEGNRKDWKEPQNIQYSLFIFDKAGAFIKEVKIGVPEMYYGEMLFGIDNAGDILFFSLYGKEFEKDKIFDQRRLVSEGTFSLKLSNENFNIIFENHKKYDGEYLKNAMSAASEKAIEKAIKKDQPITLQNLRKKEIHFNDQNEALVIYEDLVPFEKGTAESASGVQRGYNFNSILIFGIDAEGKLKFQKSIFRSIPRLAPENFSFNFIKEMNSASLIYLDHPDANGKEKTYCQFNDVNFTLYQTNIEFDGKVTTRNLGSFNEDDLKSSNKALPARTYFSSLDKDNFLVSGYLLKGFTLKSGIWFFNRN